jgi:hypothetical protein
VRQLAAMHGGTAEAGSPGVGKGSVFSIRMPLAARPELPAMREKAPADEPMPARPLKVLIVDDNVVEPSKQRVPRVGKGSVFSIRACLGHE